MSAPGKNIKDEDDEFRAWTREADVMGQLSHEHIVRLLHASFSPWPQLYLEYIPGGSLYDQEDLSLDECLQILRQLLSALVYLHGRNPPIVHRDIKLENILVQHRHAGNIHVKFGDFGLSRERRESGDWKTICGTWKYAAPEILENKKYIESGGRETRRYTAAVDIWSLGVVMYKLLCGLPGYKEAYTDKGALWGTKIVEKLQQDLEKRPNEVIQFLATSMLNIQPELRGSALDCYNRTMLLSSATKVMNPNPTPASDAGCEQVTARPVEHKGDKGQDPQTAFRDSRWRQDNAINAAEMRECARPDNPARPAADRKRAVHSAKSTSSKTKDTKRSRHAGLEAQPPSRGLEEGVGRDMHAAASGSGHGQVEYMNNTVPPVQEQQLTAKLLLNMKNNKGHREGWAAQLMNS